MRSVHDYYYYFLIFVIIILSSSILLSESLIILDNKRLRLLVFTPFVLSNRLQLRPLLTSFYPGASLEYPRYSYSSEASSFRRYHYVRTTPRETSGRHDTDATTLTRASMSYSQESLSTSDTDQGEESNASRPALFHFCFLVHGLMGNDKEMSYLETALHKAVATSCSEEERKHQSFFFHKATSNVDRTYDGISNGGKRLAEEVKDYIKRTISQIRVQNNQSGKTSQNFTVSLVGNSLGGLYARYAIAELFRERQENQNGFLLDLVEGNISTQQENLSHTIRVHFNVFATTACPHLGVHKHTFISIPRFLEKASAHFLGNTGRDLFRLTGLLREMTLSPKYLDPLGKFRSRIAYSNAHNTDFQVPTKTAAFLCESSRYPHTLEKSDKFLTSPWIVGIFNTKKMEKDMYEIIGEYKATAECNANNDHDQIEMSVALDSLGWKKVFVDVRDLLPFSLKIPWINEKSILDHTKKNSENCCNDDVIFESRELIPFVTASNRISIPMGHTTMVANSKTEFISWLNSKGRSVMDNFAVELVNDMKHWNP
jgi:hypothetical protein